MLLKALIALGSQADPIIRVTKNSNTDDNGNLTLSGSFEAGDIVVFGVALSLENTFKTYTVGNTATFDGDGDTAYFTDSVTGITDDRYVQTFVYEIPSTTTDLDIVWTGLSALEISNAGVDIQLYKAAVVFRNARTTPYDSDNISLTADGSGAVSEKAGGATYAFYVSFKSDGRGDSWNPSQPSGSNTLIATFSNEIVVGANWTETANGTATFSFTEPLTEDHYLIGHFISFEPA